MYWEDDTKPDTVGKVRISENHKLVNVTGLRPNTVYYLCVAAFNTAGPGPQSAAINATTKKPRESLCGRGGGIEITSMNRARPPLGRQRLNVTTEAFLWLCRSCP